MFARNSIRKALSTIALVAMPVAACGDDTPPPRAVDVLEPERVPLDRPWQARYPLRLTPLVGAKITPTSDAPIRFSFDITDAFLDINDPDKGRAEIDHHFIRLVLTVTSEGCSANSYLGASRFGVIVDDRTYPPISRVNDTLDEGESLDLNVVFSVPANTSELEVSFNTSSAEPLQRIAVDLADAEPVDPS